MTDAALQFPRRPQGLVTTEAGLAEVCEHLAAAGRFGFDTEFDSASSYRPKLCLMQVATDERVELIDPLALGDVTPLWELLADPAVEKICHAGEQDLKFAWELARLAPQNVFDTQTAAALVGIGPEVGYAWLVEELTGIAPVDGQTRSDWARRALSPAQFAYAVDDVRYLPTIRRALGEKLEALDRTGWMQGAGREECARAAAGDAPLVAFRRIGLRSRLGPQQLSVLWELTQLREELAERDARPVGWVLKDDPAAKLAEFGPETRSALGRVKSLAPEQIARYGDQFVAAVKRGKQLPADQRPHLPPPPPDTPETKRLADVIGAASQLICHAQQVWPQAVMSRDEREELLRLMSWGEDVSGHALMGGWRRECLGDPLLEFVSGETGVTLYVKQGQMRAAFTPRD